MDFNIEVRKKQLDSLGQLISSSKDRLNSVLTFLGWSADKLKKEEEPLTKCPLSSTHKMPLKSVEKHLEKCMVRIEGYDLSEKFLSEPPADSKQTIYMDNTKKIEILSRAYTERPHFRQAWNGRDPDPKTSDRLISTFSPDERLALYDYSIQNTVGPPPPPDFSTLTFHKRDEDKPLSYEELLAQERDAKRRRAKYRSVHVNRKNHIEVMREVINSQMDDYNDWLSLLNSNNKKSEDCNDRINGKSEERSHSSVSNSERRRLRDRSRSRDRRRSRDRSRERKRCGDRRRSWDRNEQSSRRRDLSRDRRRTSRESSRRRSEDRRCRNDSRQRARSPYKRRSNGRSDKRYRDRSKSRKSRDRSSSRRVKEKASSQKGKDKNGNDSCEKKKEESSNQTEKSSNRREKESSQKSKDMLKEKDSSSLKERDRSSRREENSSNQRKKLAN